MAKITTTPATINGKTRWHFATVRADSSLNKSIKTWANKRDAKEAGERGWKVRG